MNCACRGNRSEARSQLLEIETIEQLHDVVERPVVGDAEIVKLDRMWRAKRRRGFSFALAALHYDSLRIGATGIQHRGGNQLERSGAGEQAVRAAVYLSHTAHSQSFLQCVAAELARFSHLPTKS